MEAKNDYLNHLPSRILDSNNYRLEDSNGKPLLAIIFTQRFQKMKAIVIRYVFVSSFVGFHSVVRHVLRLWFISSNVFFLVFFCVFSEILPFYQQECFTNVIGDEVMYIHQNVDSSLHD